MSWKKILIFKKFFVVFVFIFFVFTPEINAQPNEDSYAPLPEEGGEASGSLLPPRDGSDNSDADPINIDDVPERTGPNQASDSNDGPTTNAPRTNSTNPPASLPDNTPSTYSPQNSGGPTEYVPLVGGLGEIAEKLTGEKRLPTDIKKLINFAFYIGLGVIVILAIFGIIRGGYVYLTSADSGDKKSRAKKIIQASLGGLLLGLCSWLILYTINPSILIFNPTYEKLRAPEVVEISALETEVIPPNGPPFFIAEGSGLYTAEFTRINNPNQLSASADGSIVINGHTYYFRSGGGGRGYLPAGTYVVSNGRIRNDYDDQPGMFVSDNSSPTGWYGYSFDLSNAYDSRVGGTRTDLRIHPDGRNPGTAGCIGIQGDLQEQRRFYSDMSEVLNRNGGNYTITVGGN